MVEYLTFLSPGSCQCFVRRLKVAVIVKAEDVLTVVVSDDIRDVDFVVTGFRPLAASPHTGVSVSQSRQAGNCDVSVNMDPVSVRI